RQTIAASSGRQISLSSNGTVERVSLRDGKTALFRPNGQVRSVQAGGTQIHYNLRGQRHIMTERSDRSVLVSTGRNSGYLQRPLVVQNRTYVQRTYVVNNVTYTRVYRTSNYGGVAYSHYVPVSYYRPVFYRWVYDPWPAPA